MNKLHELEKGFSGKNICVYKWHSIHISALEQAEVLILSKYMYVLLG